MHIRIFLLCLLYSLHMRIFIIWYVIAIIKYGYLRVLLTICRLRLFLFIFIIMYVLLEAVFLCFLFLYIVSLSWFCQYNHSFITYVTFSLVTYAFCGISIITLPTRLWAPHQCVIKFLLRI